MYVAEPAVSLFAGLGAVGDRVVAAVGSVLRLPAGALVDVGVWTYQEETDPARLAQGIHGNEKWVFHTARVQNDVDMQMPQDVSLEATADPGVYKLSYMTWAGKPSMALTAADTDTGRVYAPTGDPLMVQIEPSQLVGVVTAGSGSTAMPASVPVTPPATPSVTCSDGQWLASDGTCVPQVIVTPVGPTPASKPWYKRTSTYVVGGLVVVGGVVAIALARRRRG